jgi:predicted SnoaL-like aldol condensation-catalyzing enzyme
LSRGGGSRIVSPVDDVAERNKRKVRFFVDAVWNEGRIELIDELVADDYVGHMPRLDAGVLGPGGVRRLVSGRRRALPGLHVQIDDQVAEDDLVVTRWRATTSGAQRASGLRTPCCEGISIIRLLAGKQVDCHELCAELPQHRPRSRSAV